jgi:hypothetical protein
MSMARTLSEEFTNLGRELAAKETEPIDVECLAYDVAKRLAWQNESLKQTLKDRQDLPAVAVRPRLAHLAGP